MLFRGITSLGRKAKDFHAALLFNHWLIGIMQIEQCVNLIYIQTSSTE